MSDLFITWIMWAIVATSNPNVNIVAVIDEYPEPGKCQTIAEMVAVATAEDVQAKGTTGLESITIVCIPTLTRESKDANKSLLQPLSGTGHQRTTVG